MADLPTLQKRLETLQRVRASGVLTLEGPDGTGRVTYRSDGDLVAAIAAVESEISKAQGRRRVRTFRIFSSKGW